MPELIELIYASRCNVAPSTGHRQGEDVEPEIGRILNQSRRNNEPQRIGGVLCFGNDIFFQCLEGERDVVEKLYDKLHRDSRHSEITLLRKKPINRRRFKSWAMKYLTLDRALREEFKRHGHRRFDPFGFDEETTDDVLEMLRISTEAPKPTADAPEPKFPGDSSQLKAYTLAIGAVVVTFAVIAWVLL